MIDKTTFCEVIEMLRQQMNFDRRIGDTIQDTFGVQKECSYSDNMARQAIIKWFKVHFPKDEHGCCEIEYYCLFVEFGKQENGEIMTPEELYDSLINLQKN